MKLTLFAQIPTSGLEYWRFFNFYITARNIVKILKSGVFISYKMIQKLSELVEI